MLARDLPADMTTAHWQDAALQCLSASCTVWAELRSSHFHVARNIQLLSVLLLFSALEKLTAFQNQTSAQIKILFFSFSGGTFIQYVFLSVLAAPFVCEPRRPK